MTSAPREPIVILGAAGRDFHNFNVAYRDDPRHEVVAFTAAQIEGIAGRRYPPSLAGPLYPDGIPIVPESELERWCATHRVRQVVFAYSDVPHAHVMHLASRALAAGADFALLGPERTMLSAAKPVIAVSAVRTGCGKSQTARWLTRLLRRLGLRAAVVRHPMPYGDLERQAVQRFATAADLAAAQCTIEEREEYEPHLAAGSAVHAGVDYARVLANAGRDGDLIVWDGGNNDFPFVRPDLHIVLIDALRPEDALAHHPGEAVLRMADIVVVAKADAAGPEAAQRAAEIAHAANPRAVVVRAGSPVTLDDETVVRGRRVVVVEDGPTLTHGGMPHGAGYAAARRAGALIVDPRPYAAPLIAAALSAHPHIGPVLPALGYRPEQVAALKDTLAAVPAEVLVAGTPVDPAAWVPPGRTVVRARYELADMDRPGLEDAVVAFLRERGLLSASG